MADGFEFDPDRLGISKPAYLALLRYMEAPAERTRRNMVLKMLGFAPIKAKTCQTLINEALRADVIQCVFAASHGQRWYAAGPSHPTTPQPKYRR